ncbi:MAG: GNAT family N-acetyltransferase [Ilumatobacteraceae bacterium]
MPFLNDHGRRGSGPTRALFVSRTSALGRTNRSGRRAIPSTSVEHRIRPATAADARSIAVLNGFVQALHVEHRPDRFRPPDADAFAPVVEGWLGSPNRRIWLADDTNDTTVGYVMGVRIDRPPTALVAGATIVELDQVVVDPVSRGRGIATALCGEVFQWAAELGADRIELSTWAFNESAQSLFVSLGFTPDYLRLSRSTHNA